jgi:hypothetical protein
MKVDVGILVIQFLNRHWFCHCSRLSSMSLSWHEQSFRGIHLL